MRQRAALEAHRLEGLLHFRFEIARQLRCALRILTLGRNRDATREGGFELARIEVLLGASNGGGAVHDFPLRCLVRQLSRARATDTGGRRRRRSDTTSAPERWHCSASSAAGSADGKGIPTADSSDPETQGRARRREHRGPVPASAHLRAAPAYTDAAAYGKVDRYPPARRPCRGTSPPLVLRCARPPPGC